MRVYRSAPREPNSCGKPIRHILFQRFLRALTRSTQSHCSHTVGFLNPFTAMADERDQARRWQTQSALVAGGAAALIGIYMAREPVRRALTVASNTAQDEVSSTVEEAGSNILDAVANAVSSVAAGIRRKVYDTFPGAAPPASVQQQMSSSQQKETVTRADEGAAPARKRAACTDEGAQVRTRRMRQGPDAYDECTSPVAPSSTCKTAPPQEYASSCQTMTTISTVQSEYHNHSGNEFERLVEVPVRDRNHLLELLSQVEDSHEEGREPIDTIFFGQFRGAPNGFGRFPGKAKIINVEKAIGEIVYNFQVAWEDGDQTRTELRADKKVFIQACIKAIAAPARAASPQQTSSPPALPEEGEVDQPSAEAGAQVTPSSSQDPTEEIVSPMLTAMDSMTAAAGDEESPPQNDDEQKQVILDTLIATRDQVKRDDPTTPQVYSPAGAQGWLVKWKPRMRPSAKKTGDVYFVQLGGRVFRSINDVKLALGLTTIETEVALPQQAASQDWTLAERAQLDPASLIGARVCANWAADQRFTSQVMAIRESEGPPRLRFQAHVKYEYDEVEQWEVIGVYPYYHTLVSEPSRRWKRTGSPYVDKYTMLQHQGALCLGVVMCWLPKVEEGGTDENENDLYKVYHDDGDYGDMEIEELKEAIKLFDMKNENFPLSEPSSSE